MCSLAETKTKLGAQFIMDLISKLTGANAAHPSHRIAGLVELGLQFLTAAGIVGLLIALSQATTLLAPGESEVLFRARLMRGIFSLAVPLVILLFLSSMRVKFTSLLEEKISDPTAITSARYMWVLVVAFSVIIIAISVSLILDSVGEFKFA